jgi:hypothetical protein
MRKLRSMPPRPVSGSILPALLAGALIAAGVRAAPSRPAGRAHPQGTAPAPAANPYSPDRASPGSVEAIAGLTSSLRFLPPAVAYLPATPDGSGVAGGLVGSGVAGSTAADVPAVPSDQGAPAAPGAAAGAAGPAVPSPDAVLGHVAGAADVAGAAAVNGYFRRLAAASDRVRVQTLGSSEEGREIVLAAVSAAHNLTELAYFRDAAARLADPRRTDAAAAERLAGSGKLLYYLVGGSEPGEVASPEMLAELAYRLAVSERPEIAAVREEAVVLITPVAEPDAYDRAVEWDRRQLRPRTGVPWESLAEILQPPYASHYAGAGWAALGGEAGPLASTRAAEAAFFGFHPQLVQGFSLRTAAPPLVAFGDGTGRGCSGVGGTAGSMAAPAAQARGVSGGNMAARAQQASGGEDGLASGETAQAGGQGAPAGGGSAPAGGQGAPAGGGSAPAGGESAPAGSEDELATGADPWLAAARAVAASLQGDGMPGVAGLPPRGEPGRCGAAALALAIDHNAAGGVVAVFGNGAAGAFDRRVGELEPSPPPAAVGTAAPGVAPAGPGAARAAPRASPVGSADSRGAPASRAAPTVAPRAQAEGTGQVRTPAGGWPPGGRTRWSLRDTVNYAQSATLEALAWAAAHRRELLFGTWRRGERALRQAQDEGGPAAWVFAARQSDPARLAALVRRLLEQRIEVHRLSGDVTVAGRQLPAGSYLVRLDQPYRAAALRHLGGGPGAAVGWPWLYGVQGEAISDRSILDAPMAEVTAPAPIPGRVVGGTAGAVGTVGGEPAVGSSAGAGAAGVAGAAGTPIRDMSAAAGEPSGSGAAGAAGAAARDEVFLLRDTGQTSLLAARLAIGTYQVDAAEEPFQAGGTSYPAGSWIVQAPRERVERVAARLGLTLAAATLPEVPRHVVHLPRLAVLHGWIDTEPSAWLRAVLDAEHLPYSLIADDDVRRGGLGERFDLILLAGTAADWQRTLRGIDSQWVPLAYTRGSEAPSLGVPDAAADITGGWGDAGLLELRHFVEGGGVLVTLGSASALAAGAGLAPGVMVEPLAMPEVPTTHATEASPATPTIGETSAGATEVGATPGPDAADATGAAFPQGARDEAALPGPAGESTAPGDASPGRIGSLAPAAELRVHAVSARHPALYGYPAVTQVLRRGGPRLALLPSARARVVLAFGAGSVAAGGEGGGGPGGQSAAESGAEQARRSGIEVEDIEAATPAAGSGAAPPAHLTVAEPSSTVPGAAVGAPLPGPLGPLDGRLLLAGGLPAGEAALDGRPAIVDVPLGRGHVILFAFDPIDPTFGTADLRFVYNVLLNWHALPR